MDFTSEKHVRRPQKGNAAIAYDTPTRCCFNVRSKADISQFNLPHGTSSKKVENRKLKSKKTDML